MSERIRVEITEEMPGFTTTFAAEALSTSDAVNAVMLTYQEYEDVDDE